MQKKQMDWETRAKHNFTLAARCRCMSTIPEKARASYYPKLRSLATFDSGPGRKGLANNFIGAQGALFAYVQDPRQSKNTAVAQGATVLAFRGTQSGECSGGGDSGSARAGAGGGGDECAAGLQGCGAAAAGVGNWCY